MSRLLGLLYSLKAVLRRGTADRDTAEEIDFHIERQTNKHVAAGLPPSTARALAVREFGGARFWREATGDARAGHLADTLGRDLRYALRVLAQHRAFTAVASLTLIIAMSATIAAYTLVDNVLLRPLPYPASERLVSIAEVDSLGYVLPFSIPNFNDLRAESRGFTAMAAVIPDFAPQLASVGERTASVEGANVHGPLFDILGVRPWAGRALDTTDAGRSAPRVVVLSHAFWQRFFGGDRSALGTRLRLGAANYTIVGIMPPSFRYPDNADFWTACNWCTQPPMGMRPSIMARVVARLAPNATLEQAAREANRVAARLHAAFPNLAENQMMTAQVRSLAETTVGAVRGRLWSFGAAVACVLLIACGNIAGANIARNATRRRELSLRTALGASRRRVIQQLVVESLVLVMTCGVVGVAGAWWIVRQVAQHAMGKLPRMGEVTVDLQSAVFALGVCLFVALCVGGLPALGVPTASLQAAFSGTRGGLGAEGRRRARNWLIGGEVALSLVLLVGAGLALRSLQRVLREPIGVEAQGVITIRPWMSFRRYQNPTSQLRFADDVLARLREVPGVDGAASASTPPLGVQWTGFVEVEGRDLKGAGAGYNLVSEDYFSTVGVRLVRGRLFTRSDDSTTDHVTVINREMADRYWPKEDPIGKRVRALSMDSQNMRWLTVVGIVENVRSFGLDTDMMPMQYVSARQRPERVIGNLFVVRSARPTGLLASGLRQALRDVEPTAIGEIVTVDDRIRETTQTRRLMMRMLAAFAAVAMLLVAIGVYGVLSYTVVLRTREIGIRLALGAERQGVVRLMLVEVLRPVVVGLVLGVVGVRLASGVLESIVYKLSPMDPPVLVATCLALIGLAVLAGMIPTRRAASVDPLISLRAE